MGAGLFQGTPANSPYSFQQNYEVEASNQNYYFFLKKKLLVVVVFVCVCVGGGKFPLFPGESDTSKPLCGYEQNGSITHFTLITIKVKAVLTPIRFLQKNVLITLLDL